MYGIVLFGMPCSGKSAIGKAYSQRYDCAYISSGDIARKMAENDDNVAEDLKTGKMAPEMQMRMSVMAEIKRCMMHGLNFVLDGFPRFKEQDEWLHETVPELNLIYVLVDIDRDTAIARARNRARVDDNSINNRIEYYITNTHPILNTYNHIILDNSGADVRFGYAEMIYTEAMKYVNN